MTQPEAVVVAATVSGMAALIGAIIAAAVALRNETRRRRSSQQESESQAVRNQAAEVFRHMFSLQHEMEWLTWHASRRPKSIDRQMVDKYEATAHATYPKLPGELAVIASLDIGVYQRLAPLVEQICDFESEIGDILTGLTDRGRKGAAVSELAALFQPVKKIYTSLPPALADVMSYAKSDGAVNRSRL